MRKSLICQCGASLPPPPGQRFYSDHCKSSYDVVSLPSSREQPFIFNTAESLGLVRISWQSAERQLSS